VLRSDAERSDSIRTSLISTSSLDSVCRRSRAAAACSSA
jgi:hypothetical protein